MSEMAARAYEDRKSDSTALSEPVELQLEAASQSERAADSMRYHHRSKLQRYLKAVDRQGNMLGAAWFSLPGKQDPPPPKKPTDEDRATDRAFDTDRALRIAQTSEEARKRAIGDKDDLYSLIMMIVDPKYQRRGVGQTVSFLPTSTGPH